MSDDRKDLPPVSAPNFNERLRETLSTYLGNRGNKLDRGLILRDLVDANIIKLRSGFLAGSGGGSSPIIGVGTAISDAYEPDLTPPPTPEGFAVSAAISNIFIEHAAPLYPQGHGHARTVVYGATWPGVPAALPTFSTAVKTTEFTGTVFAHPSNPATTWHLWIKWQSVDGVESAAPAGGTNGLVVRTGEDVRLLLEALNGEITQSQLFSALGARIDLIDGTGAGSVTARVATESTTRAGETGALFAQYTVKVDVNGYVAGYGLASSVVNGTPTSEFIIRADKFAIAPVATDNTAADGSPFFYRTVATTINGVSVPAGAYMKAAFIHDATITNAKIANLAVDNAKIANLAVSKLDAGSLKVGAFISSSNYIAGTQGFRINADGLAEFSNVVVRGTVFASVGQIGGNVIDSTGVQSPGYVQGSVGWRLDSSGALYAKSGQFSGSITGATGTFSGALSGATGSFAGSLSAATGTFAGSLSAATGSFSGSLSAASGTFSGSLTASAINAVNTINLAGNSVSVMSESSGIATTISTTLTIPANETMRIIAIGFVTGTDPGASTPSQDYCTLSVNGVSTSVVLGSAATYNGGEAGIAYGISAGSVMQSAALAGGVSGKTITVSFTKPYRQGALVAFGAIR